MIGACLYVPRNCYSARLAVGQRLLGQYNTAPRSTVPFLQPVIYISRHRYVVSYSQAQHNTAWGLY